MTRAAYLGPEGSFSEDAARAHFGPQAELVPFGDIPAVVSAVTHRLVDAAVVPIENSIEGSVSVTLDELVHAAAPPRLPAAPTGSWAGIVAELNLPVRHHLVARPGTTLSEIQRLVAHPQALAQCRRWVQEHLPQVQVLPALSNSAAVQSLVHSSAIAALGPERAARLYGMEIIARDVQDAADNLTRFVVLAHDPAPPTGADRTSICCSIAEDRPGSLLAILREFADRGVNLTKVESRPTRGGLGKYFFLIDLEGHESDPLVAAALAGARDASFDLRILGSYPAARPEPASTSGS
jgi:prephenate dehydratase